jgi:hypothetical protein
MLPPALAIAWMIWRRHRWTLILCTGYLVIVVIAMQVLLAQDLSLNSAFVSSGLVRGTFAVVLQFLFGFPIFLGLTFCLAYDADLNARGSCFPADLFTLPVRTVALAGWHIAYGALSMFVVLVATIGLVLRPGLAAFAGISGVPLWWPAVLAVAFLACLQGMLWLPFGLAGVRIIVATILLSALVFVATYAAESGVSESRLVMSFATVAVLGWIGAYEGVRRGRRGDVPSWDALFRPVRRLVQWWPRRRVPFASPAAAQVWFEWRRAGRSLPGMTALVLPVALFPLFLGKNDVLPTSNILLGALAIPVVMAGLAGLTVSGRHPWVKDYYGVAPFTATLPMSTADMVGAKLKSAARSVLSAWFLVLLAILVAVPLAGRVDDVADLWRRALRGQDAFSLVAGLLAVFIMLIVWTWKRQVDSLVVGLTGRKWIIVISVVLAMVTFAVACILGGWIIDHPEKLPAIRAWLPWLLAGMLIVRLAVTGLALRQLLDRELLARRTLGRWIAAWLLLAATLFALLVSSIRAEQVPWYYLAFAAVWCLPMTHLAATPLALAWNRHR